MINMCYFCINNFNFKNKTKQNKTLSHFFRKSDFNRKTQIVSSGKLLTFHCFKKEEIVSMENIHQIGKFLFQNGSCFFPFTQWWAKKKI